MAIIFWLTRPRMLFHRVRYWLWEKANPDKPWLCNGSISFCQNHLNRSMRALEFGSGRSTLWFASQVGTLTSIEHDRKWYEHVREKLTSKKIRNVDYRFVGLNHLQEAAEQEVYLPAPDYVSVVDSFSDESLDLVIIDGHYRTHCIRHSISKIAKGGYLLVDDTNLWPTPDSLPIPRNWNIVDDSTNGVKRCMIWQAPQ